jgi:hypothetical protein
VPWRILSKHYDLVPLDRLLAVSITPQRQFQYEPRLTSQIQFRQYHFAFAQRRITAKGVGILPLHPEAKVRYDERKAGS